MNFDKNDTAVVFTVIAHLKVNKFGQQPVSSGLIPFWAVKSLWV